MILEDFKLNLLKMFVYFAKNPHLNYKNKYLQFLYFIHVDTKFVNYAKLITNIKLKLIKTKIDVYRNNVIS